MRDWATHQARRAESLKEIARMDAMSTDSPIPERWRAMYQWVPPYEYAETSDIRTVIEELGTAESLVRDLARALQISQLADKCRGVDTDDGFPADLLEQYTSVRKEYGLKDKFHHSGDQLQSLYRRLRDAALSRAAKESR